jgi:hypothetical protein
MQKLRLMLEHYTNPLTLFVMLRKCGICKAKAMRIAGLYEKFLG